MLLNGCAGSAGAGYILKLSESLLLSDTIRVLATLLGGPGRATRTRIHGSVQRLKFVALVVSLTLVTTAGIIGQPRWAGRRALHL